MTIGHWQLQPLTITLAVLALALYAGGWRRLRRRHPDRARPLAAALYGAGVLLACLSLVSPLNYYSLEKLFTAHMAQILLIGDLAPLLIVAGLRRPAGFSFLPDAAERLVAPLRRPIAPLLRPKASLAVWFLGVYVWHIPALYDAAVVHPALLDAENASYVLIGLLVWTQIIDPARTQRLAPGRRAVFAFAVLLAGSPLAEILLLTGSFYRHYTAIIDRPFGWSATEDQVHAALLMMAEQIATLGTAAGVLLWEHLEALDAAALREAPLAPFPETADDGRRPTATASGP